MKPRWVCGAALGLLIVLGWLPAVASGQSALSSKGSASRVGDRSDGGQIRISGTYPGGGADLRQCTFTISKVLVSVFRVGGAEQEESPGAFIGVRIAARRGSDRNDATYESNQKQQPTLAVRIKDRGKVIGGHRVLEFELKLDRAVIDANGDVIPNLPGVLRTAFELSCPRQVFSFTSEPRWGPSGGDNIEHPFTRQLRVDLDVDTNRNGKVEDTEDEDGEDRFTHERGAVLQVNLDDSDGDGASDSKNNKIDGGDDKRDITELHIRKSEFDKVPAGFEYVLRMNKDIAARWARIFDKIAADRVEVLGPGAGVVNGNFKEFVVPAASMEGAGTLVYGIEAITYPRKDSTAPGDPAKNFDGIVDVDLILRRVAAPEQIIDSDNVRLRATPWLMLGHLFGNEEVFVVETADNGDFVKDLKQILKDVGLDPDKRLIRADGATYKDSDGKQDRWMQDEIEIGFNKSPTSAMHSVLDGPRDRGLDGYAEAELLGQGIAAFRIDRALPPGDPGQSLNSFGNLEVTPPLRAEGKDWLLGRIYYGSTPGDREPQRSLREFLEAQDIQRPVPLDSAWLLVGHVDEFISFIPFPDAGAKDKSFKVLLASPKRAIELFEQESANGRGGDVTKVGQTVDMVITRHKDQNLNDWQPRIDGVKTVMKAKLGLADADFIDIPVLFAPYAAHGKDRASAYFPDLVNLLVVNGHLIAPKPFFDLFKEDFETKLAAIGYKRPSDHNPTIHFIDNYDAYHKGNGSVHCGTNSRRVLPATPNWWEQR